MYNHSQYRIWINNMYYIFVVVLILLSSNFIVWSSFLSRFLLLLLLRCLLAVENRIRYRHLLFRGGNKSQRLKTSEEARKKKIQNWHTLKISLLVQNAKCIIQPVRREANESGKNTCDMKVMALLIGDIDIIKHLFNYVTLAYYLSCWIAIHT